MYAGLTRSELIAGLTGRFGEMLENKWRINNLACAAFRKPTKNMNAKTKLTSKSGPLRRAVSMLLFGAGAAAALWAIMPPRALSQSHAQDQSAALSKIAPWVLQHTADGKEAEFLVVLSEQADLSRAAALPTK